MPKIGVDSDVTCLDDAALGQVLGLPLGYLALQVILH